MSSEKSSVASDHAIVKVNNNSKRLILRQRLAIQALVVLCLLVTMLFVWQLTVNVIRGKEDSSKKSQQSLTNDNLLEIEGRPCPIVPAQRLLPRLLPATVSNGLGVVDVVYKSLTKLNELEGLATSIVYKEKVVWKRTHGVRDKNASVPNPPDENTVFRVASVSKIITVFFVFHLLSTGSISSLDDHLDKYESKFAVINKFNSEKISIRHILTHTSGLPREVPCGENWSVSSTNLCPVNTTYVLEKLKTMSLKSPPGREPNYSNLGFALLARVLAQRFANGNYEGWVKRNVLSPLNMFNSGFDVKSMSSNRAVSYGFSGLNSNVDWGWAAPAIQFYSTAADLSKLMMALFQATPVKIVRSDLLMQVLTPNFVYPDGKTMVGLGWEMKLTGSYILVFKAGIVPGYSAGFAFYPKLQLGSVVLMTGREVAPAGAELLLKPLAYRFVSYLVQQGQIEVPSNPSKYIGSYLLVSKWIERVFFRITLEDNVLQLQQLPGFPQVSYLNFIEDNLLELVYKPGFTCSVYGMGQNHERLRFEAADSSGRSPSFYFGSFQFVRIKDSTISISTSVKSKTTLSKIL